MIDYDEYKEVLRIAGRQNFWAFCNYMDYDFFQRRKFLKQPSMLLQHLFECMIIGIAITIGISMPPRSGKSYLVSMFCAWLLGMVPQTSIMRNTCTSTLYDKLSYDTRAIVMSAKYKEVFPEIEMSGNKANLSGWNTNHAKQVSYFGAGVGGTIIGFGANIAINDDLYKSMQDALSSTTNSGVKLWKQSAHDSRKEKACPEIFIGTRWTIDDVIGEALENGKILPENYICIPALEEINGELVSFCEDVKTTQEYLSIKSEIEESVWNAEYMQQPIEVKGLLFPKQELRFENLSKYDTSQAIWSFAVGDPADKGGDYYAMPFMHVMPDFDIIVKHVICNKDGIDANTVRIAEKILDIGVEKTFIEANGGWIASVMALKDRIKLISGFDDEKMREILTAYKNTIDKMVRMLSNYEFVKKHFVFDEQYKKDSEYSAFISVLTKIRKEGANANDDSGDVLCAAANIVKVKYKDFLYGRSKI